MSTSIVDSLPVREQQLQAAPADTIADGWKPLYRIGAVAALISIAFIVIAGVVFATNPPPTTIEGWFRLYHDNWLVGLLDADLMMLASYVMTGVIYFALYGALRKVNQPFMALATALAFVSMAAYYAANPAFSMLTLSNQFAAATTDAERVAIQGAGRAVMANWTGTAFDMAYFLSAIALIIVSLVMLRSNIFGKVTAWMGLAVGVLTLVPATAGTIGVVFSFIALVPTVIWLVLIAWRFFQLGSAPQKGSILQ